MPNNERVMQLAVLVAFGVLATCVSMLVLVAGH